MHIKIGLVVAKLELGGAERAALELANLLSDGYLIKIISIKSGGRFSDLVPSNVEYVSVLNTHQQFRKYWWYTLKNLNSLLRDCDIVISTVEGLPTYLISILSIFRSSKTIAWVHTDLNRYFNIFEKLLNSLIYLKYNVIVCASQEVATTLVHLYPYLKKRLKVIYHYVNGRNKIPTRRIEYRDIDIIFVGRLEKIKGIDLLIEVIKKLKSSGFSPSVAILGDGALRQQVSADIDYFALKNVNLVGFSESPAEYMIRAKYILVISRVEGFGLALAEAMSCGVVPIVADHLGGPLEIIENGRIGYTFALSDLDQLENLIAKLLNGNLDWSRHSRQALDRSQAFTLEHTQQHWKAIIEDVFP